MSYILHTDGGARGNPGPAAIGIVLKKNGETIYEFGSYIGKDTNNVAEYKAVLEGLKAALGKKVKRLTCYIDSELVVKQLTGDYKVKQAHLKFLWTQIKTIENDFIKVTYEHVKREKNSEADALVNKVLDKQQ
jgi:ribonuclease HI